MLNCLHQPWYQKKFSWPLLKLFPHTTGFQNINDVWTPLWTFQSWKVDKVDGSYPIRKKKGFTRPLDAHKREAGFALNIQLLFSKRKCAKKTTSQNWSSPWFSDNHIPLGKDRWHWFIIAPSYSTRFLGVALRKPSILSPQCISDPRCNPNSPALK